MKKFLTALFVSIFLGGIVWWQWTPISNFFTETIPNAFVKDKNVNNKDPDNDENTTPAENETPNEEEPEEFNGPVSGIFDTEGNKVMTFSQLMNECYLLEDEYGLVATDKFNELEDVILKIPSTYSSIGAHAFENCDNLREVYLPEGVQYLGFECFKNCTNLEKVSYPSTALYVNDNVFEGCSSLVYNNKNKSSFLGNEENKYVYLAASSSAFIDEECLVIGSGSLVKRNCMPAYRLNYLKIPRNVKALCSKASEGFLSIYIPNSVIVAGYKTADAGTGVIDNSYSTGHSCKIYTELTEQEVARFTGKLMQGDIYAVYSVYERDFDLTFAGGMTQKLSSNKIGGIISNIGSLDMSYTWETAIEKEFIVVEGTTIVSFNGLECSNIYIPEGITEIGAHAFDKSFEDFYMIKIYCPDSLTTIGEYAFYTERAPICGLNILFKSKNINLTSIGAHAFENQGNEFLIGDNIFEEINFDTITNVGENAFYNTKYASQFENA